MKIKALAPWFGGNRTRADVIGKAFGRLAWCGVPFAGGMPELPHIDTRCGVACDRHRHVINLARCIADPELVAQMESRFRKKLFHPDVLTSAQEDCKAWERWQLTDLKGVGPHVESAIAYFIAVWMGRGGMAGTAKEFVGSLPVRYSSRGGGSATRWWSAVDSLQEWHAALRNWEFMVEDAEILISKVWDEPSHGIYCDPPWPDLGKGYKHKAADGLHARVAKFLSKFKKTKIIVRYNDHPEIVKLYPVSKWHWLRSETKNTAGNKVREVLLFNKAAFPNKPEGAG